MRFYVKHATLAPDGLLITTGDSQPQDVVGEKNKVIVPHNIVLGLLYHMHNQSLDPHPTMNQLKVRFNRTFYPWNLQPILDSINKDCYICSVVQKQPLVPTVHQSKVQVQHPHRYFLADVIKRSGQCILLVTDHFSNLSQATVVDSEKAVDLKEGLIKLTTPIWHPGVFEVSTDNAPGFQSLAKDKDNHLQQLQIKLFTANEFNKNYNAIIDRACQELENELRKILPEGHKLDNFVLARATLAMNSKLRRKEAIAAYEMHTARKLESGHNLQLSDAKLRQSQLSARRPVTANVEPVRPKPGDTVTPVAAQDKHTVRDM